MKKPLADTDGDGDIDVDDYEIRDTDSGSELDDLLVVSTNDTAAGFVTIGMRPGRTPDELPGGALANTLLAITHKANQ